MTTVGEVKVITAEQVDMDGFDQLLSHAYSERKTAFLREWGNWRHRGAENRYILTTEDDVPIAYCAVIPAPIYLREHEQPAAWWVDLFLEPELRGQKLHLHLEGRAKVAAPIMLGVPNNLYMHRKNGWGVRDDYRTMMLPLKPSAVPLIRNMSGMRGILARLVSYAANPLMMMYRNSVLNRHIESAWIIDSPDAEEMAKVFKRYREGWITTNRDAEFIRWRYLDSPFASEYAYFGAGEQRDQPDLIAITRTFKRNKTTVTRILDIFGDLNNEQLLSNLILRITQDAIGKESVQVNAKATYPLLESVLRSNRFLLSMKSYFCWYSTDPELMARVAEGPCHWTYADSDSDSVE